jgi:hypothetical protein
MEEVKKKKSNIYFTKETENAILAFVASNDEIERNRLYDKIIHHAFFKLTENIIHTFKFYYTETDNIEDLQHEVIIFLLSKMHLYHHSQNIQDRLIKIITKNFSEEYSKDFKQYTNNSPKITQQQINAFLDNEIQGTVSDDCMKELRKMTPPKAYSYFGTITKNYLILSNQNNYRKKIETLPVSFIEDDEKFSYQSDDIKPPITHINLSQFIDKYIEYCSNNIFELFPKESEVQVADAILELFRKRNNLDVFNKKALYIYIREIIDVKTSKITKVADKLYSIFKKKYIFYLEYGYINF